MCKMPLMAAAAFFYAAAMALTAAEAALVEHTFVVSTYLVIHTCVLRLYNN